MSFAIVFPGQGSQSLGMLKELNQEFSQVKETFWEASEALGYDLWQIAQEGPLEKLDKTEYTQPILLAADIAVWRCWQALEGPLPSIAAGHSLGEYAALVCAQALNFKSAIKLVAKRARYMQHAVAENIGAMAAIIGLDEKLVSEICHNAAEDQVVSPANLNAIGQTVIAGHSEAVDRALELAKSHGAKIAKKIPVSVPSHCILMQPAALSLAEDLKNVHIDKPIITVIHNFDAKIHSDPGAIKQVIVEQLVSPVRWVETIQKIASLPIKVVIECGPGRVLSGLIKRITHELNTYHVSDLNQLNQALSELRGVVTCS